jgi:hypothetical protein
MPIHQVIERKEVSDMGLVARNITNDGETGDPLSKARRWLPSVISVKFGYSSSATPLSEGAEIQYRA